MVQAADTNGVAFGAVPEAPEIEVVVTGLQRDARIVANRGVASSGGQAVQPLRAYGHVVLARRKRGQRARAHRRVEAGTGTCRRECFVANRHVFGRRAVGVECERSHRRVARAARIAGAIADRGRVGLVASGAALHQLADRGVADGNAADAVRVIRAGRRVQRARTGEQGAQDHGAGRAAPGKPGAGGHLGNVATAAGADRLAGHGAVLVDGRHQLPRRACRLDAQLHLGGIDIRRPDRPVANLPAGHGPVGELGLGDRAVGKTAGGQWARAAGRRSARREEETAAIAVVVRPGPRQS